MNEKELKIISDSEIAQNSVSSLPTRPNAPTSMGGAGLSSPALRARFDALAMLAINKINAILKSLNGEEDATPFAKYIQTTLENGEGGTYTLYDVLEWLQSNDFAEKIILSEDGEYTLAQFYNDFNAWLSGEDFAKKIILVEVPNGENYTLAQFFQDFNITPSFGTLVGVEHWGNENVDLIHGDGISYTSKIRFNFQDFCYPTSQEFQNDTLIPIVAGDHIEFSPDDRGKVVGISAIVEQSFNENSTEAQSGIAVSGAIQPLSDSIATIQNKISSLEAQVDLYPLFTFHSNQNMEAIVSGYTDTISFNRVVDGKTEEVFNKEPSVGDIFFAYGQSADSVRFHMTAVITAIDNTDNPSQATFKALEVYEDAGEGAIAIDPNYDPKSLNAQSGKAVREAVAGVQEQIPLVLPYTFEWSDTEKVAVGADNTVNAEHFNRTPKGGDIFFINLYETHTDKYYHVSAEIQGFTDDTEDKVLFKLIEVFEYPSVDQEYSPESDNAQSGKAVREAVAGGVEAAQAYTDAKIASIPVGGGTSVPSYIVEEAERVAKNVQATRTAKSLVFSAMSDMHIYAGNDSDTHIRSILSATYAGQGVEELQKRMHLDFAAYLGDFTWGASNCTVEQLMKDITLFKGTTATTEKEVWCVGNHDTNYGKDRDRRMTTDEQYAYIGANSDGVKPYENIDRCYGYLDFENQKIRVIYLNTADTSDWDAQDGVEVKNEWISPTQIQWLADTALDLSDKTTPSEWGIVFVSHHPMHYPRHCFQYTMQLLEAYKVGQSGSIQCIVCADITESGAYENKVYKTVNYDFSSGEKAEIICNIHGHNHNCGTLVASSSTVFGQTAIEPWLVCVGIPNLCVTRENGIASKDDYWGANNGEFDENGNPVYWTKETGNAKATSFCVINIDGKTQKIYTHIFGAGRDRVISYVDGSIEGEEPEVPPVNPDEPDTPSYTNIIDTVGYTNGVRLSTSTGLPSELDGYSTTGFIRVSSGTDVIRAKGINFDSSKYGKACYVIYSKAEEVADAKMTSGYIKDIVGNGKTMNLEFDETDGSITSFTLGESFPSTATEVFIRLCGYGDGANLIVTINEPIE